MTPTPSRKPAAAARQDAKPDGLNAERFPNLAAERDWHREQHIKQAMQAGMTRSQAERHADAEMRED